MKTDKQHKDEAVKIMANLYWRFFFEGESTRSIAFHRDLVRAMVLADLVEDKKKASK